MVWKAARKSRFSTCAPRAVSHAPLAPVNYAQYASDAVFKPPGRQVGRQRPGRTRTRPGSMSSFSSAS